MRLLRTRLLLTAAALVTFLAAAPTSHAATFQLIILDGAGEGFNDTTPAAPVGGNPGTTLGQQRQNVFKAVGNVWGAILPDNVTIRVEARFDPLTPCDSTSGVLGSAGAITVAADFAGAPQPNTLYSIALANKLAGTDLATTVNDISARFNSSVDDGACLGSSGWYYGLDHQEGLDIDLFAVVLHEMGHGLGFQTFTNLSTGAFLSNTPDVFARNMLDNSSGLRWDQMNSSQRKASALHTGLLVWNGPNTRNAAPQILGHAAFVRVDSPPVIAGDKQYGTAEFGAPAPDPTLQRDVVLVNDGTGTTSDACETIVNAAQVAGKFALIDRGTCTFLQKAQRAQAAGAAGVIIGNNVAGAPPGMSGNDPSIVIPVVSITQSDATAIKGQLGVGVVASIGVDVAHLAGADDLNHAKIYAPNPLESGSSANHFDVTATPDLLMEPFINSSLTSNVDLTQYVFADIGWLGTTTGVQGGDAPIASRVQSAPNPFTASTAMRFQLEHGGKTVVEVFDARGALVKRLPEAWRPPGPQSVKWDGMDGAGHRAPAGVYFWRVRSESEELIGRMVRVE